MNMKKTSFLNQSRSYLLSLILLSFPIVAQSANFNERDLLSAIAKTESNKPIKIDPSVKPDQVMRALESLHQKLKVNENNPSKLDADTDFSRSLNAEHRKGFDKISKGFEQRVRDGSIKVIRGSHGKLEVQPGNGKNEGRGAGHTNHELLDDPNLDSELVDLYHSTGNGWWSWSTSYSWWGVKVYLNHNFLWYLCKYTTWMLNSSGLPGWIKTALGKVACLPHNCDGGYNGSTIYITWVGAFWYSC
ncbi:MAG: hypothetical protein HQK51_14450 [Oligoflexia bacterium]|nr:hypothetical protein [Oligoflexia bacterium]